MNCICKAKLQRQCHILCTAPAEPGNAEAWRDILTCHGSSCGAAASSEEIASPHVPIAFRDWLCHRCAGHYREPDRKSGDLGSGG